MENLPPKRKELVESLISYYTALGNDTEESVELEALSFMAHRGVKCVPVTPEPLGWSPQECDDGEEWDEESHSCANSFEIGQSFIIVIGMMVLLLAIVCFLTWYCYVRKTNTEKLQQERLRGFKLLHNIKHNKSSTAGPVSRAKKNDMMELGGSTVLGGPNDLSSSLSESLLDDSAIMPLKSSHSTKPPSIIDDHHIKRKKSTDRRELSRSTSSYFSTGRGRPYMDTSSITSSSVVKAGTF
eukprot:TRINITY_DN36656_c0_g1_i1.p1 TRINITY_DN36656_c0_g1~~TRINITY_DN36656_c0_g1_i1.p1  ORF type:complete len:241 (+),score=32.62 TRINITY_DN36656_c0_g1_i1:59-781(+)